MWEKNKKIEKENVLFVEGQDECNFFAVLLKTLGINKPPARSPKKTEKE